MWSSAVVLLIEAILAPEKRTVTSILWVMGLAQDKQFQRYHRVLNRAIWSSHQASLKSILDDLDTCWETAILADWYGQSDYPLEFTSNTAVWYKTGMPPVPIHWVLVRAPQGQYQSQALLCTDLDITPLEILQWFRQRWQVEVTFEEARAHLGIQTQRQWSDKVILCTTPALLALFDLVTVFAHHSQSDSPWIFPQAAWYSKQYPTFVDALALVRRQLWRFQTFPTSPRNTHVVKISTQLFDT
ncbi:MULTISPECIES: hypothetical protein [unclassified Synechocystis]|uniref:hypothetical protein n=1 Tax=unclassified Synechocystis TaxID=2640012 RepID=UPI001D141524|nr:MULTISPECIES: hypothetical protein [unclassified Synechocystis]